MSILRLLRSSAVATTAAPAPVRVHPIGAALRSAASLSDIPLACTRPATLIITRHFLDIHKFVNKEAIKEEKARINDELNRGYFADIQEFNKHGGKVRLANKTVIPSVESVKFPDLEVLSSDGRSFKLPVSNALDKNKSNVPCATLLCLSFRASSETMTKSWKGPFLDAFSSSGSTQVYEVSFIDSWFLSMSPIKHLMLRLMKKSSNPQAQIVYSFGDHYYFRKKLNILNLVTGYAFLLDKYGLIRWQGCGLASQEEVSSLLSSTSLLLDEK